MAKARKSALSAAQKWARIKPFVDASQFGLDVFDKQLGKKKPEFTRANKAKISRYFDAIYGTATTPPLKTTDKRVYKPRDPDNLTVMQHYAGMPKGLPALNVAFIPDVGEKARVKVNKKRGTVTITAMGISRTAHLFDEVAIKKTLGIAKKRMRKQRPDLKRDEDGDYDIDEADVADLSDDVFDNLAEQFADMTEGDPPGTYYQIKCGIHYVGSRSDLRHSSDIHVGTVFERDAALNMVKLLMAKYDNTGEWLKGLEVFKFPKSNIDNTAMLKYIASLNNRKLHKLYKLREARLAEDKKLRERAKRVKKAARIREKARKAKVKSPKRRK